MDFASAAYARRSSAVSRSITAENKAGEVGAGGKEASRLGPGRKGSPCIDLPPGETTLLADIEGRGVIRHVWITLPRAQGGEPYVLRNLVLRFTWDDAETPAIEVPLGDFFGCGFGEVALYSSAGAVVAPNGGLNFYVPMPFRSRAKVEVRNDHGSAVEGFFYQLDYTLDDEIGDDVMYLHARWNRTNGDNGLGHDHVIADVVGEGSYVGTQIFLTQLERFWYGEGELKFYIDGDCEWPTINGTGLEDYVGGAWAFQNRMGGDTSPTPMTFDSAFMGYHQQVFEDTTGVSPYAWGMPPSHGMYRWHFPDPIRFKESLRVELQQIGDRGGHLFERRDDVSTVAYWYQVSPEGDPNWVLADKEQRRPR